MIGPTEGYASITDFGAIQGVECQDAVALTKDYIDGKGIISVPPGLWLYKGVNYVVDKLFLWSDAEFNGAVNVMKTASQNSFLATGSTEAGPFDPLKNKSLYSATLDVLGEQHGNCYRGTVNGYSVARAACGVYMRGNSAPNSKSTFAVHGETRHGGGNTSAGSFEAACYSADGSFHGASINNTTLGSESVHPLTGLPPTLHPKATGLLITGNNNKGEMAAWQYGIRFKKHALRPGGYILEYKNFSITAAGDIIFKDGTSLLDTISSLQAEIQELKDERATIPRHLVAA